ncbi:MAG: polysaccharide biosynthesis/export family protein [Planctomycetota bacterium]
MASTPFLKFAAPRSPRILSPTCRATTRRAAISAAILVILSSITGCSTLGFAPVPVAHLMTEDTKQLLDATRTNDRVPRELSRQVPLDYTLQPGDQVFVEWIGEGGEVRLPPDQEVMADGSLDLEKFGRVLVAGLTLEQAEDLIQQSLHRQEIEKPLVNVRLVRAIQKYYVVGEVNSPGAYPLTGHETVLDAIMEAGGLTARASACDLLLARPSSPCSCRVTLPVCYRSITQLGDTTTNYHLHAGDRIFVARQSFKEELLAYISGSKTCDRCCGRQVPCRDPATQEPSNFVYTGQMIEAPKPPENTEGSGDPRASESESFTESETEPLPELFSPEADGSSRRENSEAGLDGELNFLELGPK